MQIFTTPKSFRLASHAAALLDPDLIRGNTASLSSSQIYMSGLNHGENMWLHTSSRHPNFGHLTLLVLEAVLEVVCVSFPGYVLARRGLFNTEMQKFAANLNVLLFTPCLIFTKLASQLNASMLADLAIIPVIYIVQVAISYVCSLAVAKSFGFPKRPRNFVIAMGVFGNSNSLPISLVISLSRTINGLHWDQIPGDNDDEVAARGILYLLIFQQLGQLLRWSWGLNVLLQRSTEDDAEEEHVDSALERGRGPGANILDVEHEPLMGDIAIIDSQDSYSTNRENDESQTSKRHQQKKSLSTSHSEPELRFGSGDQTPVTSRQFTSSTSSQASLSNAPPSLSGSGILPTPAQGNLLPSDQNPPIKQISTENVHPSPSDEPDAQKTKSTFKGYIDSCKRTLAKLSNKTVAGLRSAFTALPGPLQKLLARIFHGIGVFFDVIWQSMNPPLFAMAIALIVASIPSLQRLFFSDGTFVKNSITSAIRQSGGVAVPLILVVLGANLARASDPGEPRQPSEDDKIETRLLVASLLSRMVFPTVLMGVILAIAAKYLNISILDDPIFIVVCFLLAGAPSALQLAQICQLNEVYMGAMARILFHSYVIWILPSTLILVLCALKVVEWATD